MRRAISGFVLRLLIRLILLGMWVAAPAFAQDMQQGVPASQAGKLPRTEEQYQSLQKRIQKGQPGVETAKQKSASLRAEASALKHKLIETVARVQSLEREKQSIDSEIVVLVAEEHKASANFAADRVRVAHLLAILERLQSDLPPAIALEPNDALQAARGAMVLGASLPHLYGAAAQLVERIEVLRQSRDRLAERRRRAAQNLVALTGARHDLDQLLAKREEEAGAATQTYTALQAQLEVIVKQAGDLKSLLDRVAALRAGVTEPGMTVVTAASERSSEHLLRGGLIPPVVGQILPAGLDRPKEPGVTYLTASAAAVVAPADGRVLFGGRYHKTGQVLILELAGGYDVVLAGLDRVDVRAGDQLLAGEPVGKMPPSNGARLTFELRQGGKDIDPAPWLGINLRKAKKS